VNVGRDARRPIAHLVDSNLERRRRAIEPPREVRQRAIAAVAHAIDDRADPSVQGTISAVVAREEARDRRTIGRLDDLHGCRIPPVLPFPPILPTARSY
jgi:hypothetical protein